MHVASPCGLTSWSQCPFEASKLTFYRFVHQTTARTRAYFHFLLHKRLDAILATCKPRKRVVIAMDGPAPLAKLLEQRWGKVGQH